MFLSAKATFVPWISVALFIALAIMLYKIFNWKAVIVFCAGLTLMKNCKDDNAEYYWKALNEESTVQKNTGAYKLISKPSRFVGCGVMACAYEFVFLDSSDSTEKIGIIKCPDGYEENFFAENKAYKINFTTDTSAITGYTVANHYNTGSLIVPHFIVQEISRIE